jgi:hypothetical protein
MSNRLSGGGYLKRERERKRKKLLTDLELLYE